MNRTQNEVLAEHHAANVLADFFEEAVKRGHGSDVAKWPGELFDALVRTPITAYQERLRDLALKDEGASVPF